MKYNLFVQYIGIYSKKIKRKKRKKEWKTNSISCKSIQCMNSDFCGQDWAPTTNFQDCRCVNMGSFTPPVMTFIKNKNKINTQTPLNYCGCIFWITCLQMFYAQLDKLLFMHQSHLQTAAWLHIYSHVQINSRVFIYKKKWLNLKIPIIAYILNQICYRLPFTMKKVEKKIIRLFNKNSIVKFI